MKVSYKELVRTYRGKKDGIVYYYHPGLECYIAREYVKPKATENNRKTGAIMKNLKALNISEAYRSDLNYYLKLLRSHAKTEHYMRGNQWSMFLKLMWAMAKQRGLDLETLTRDMIESDNLPCRSVKAAVEAGLLPRVNGYELMTSVM
jgi:hypothetical protein